MGQNNHTCLHQPPDAVFKNKIYVFPALLLCFILLQHADCKLQDAGKTGTGAIVLDTIPYALENPSLIINLANEELREISGLSNADSTGIFCAISDERGEVMFVEGNAGGKVKRRVLFREKGDFEGIEMVGKTLYALKSDGKLFEIERWRDPSKMSVNEYKTALKKEDDLEGLGFDIKKNELLLAAKGDPEQDTTRLVWAFNLKTKQLSNKPVYHIDPKEVNALVPYNLEEKRHFFSPSGIAIHPKTKDIYLISTALKRMVVLNAADGTIRFAARLDRNLLPQPEGIAFDEAGNLYLSSEGKKKEGLILKFNYKK
jgi:uncharacterized protein YjiK